jgi:DNA-binding NarL/FixJ family response regulator
VLLADDHAMVLAGLSSLVEREFDLVGTARDGRELVELSARLVPDVVVADISMPLLNGLDAVRRLKKTSPSVKVVFLTMHGDIDFATEAFRAGASGYLLKHSAAEELSTAIHEALQGRVYITPLIAKGLLASLMEHPGASNEDRSDLTPRQREVLQLIAEGRAIKEIAAVLNVSPRTVEFHKTNLVKALGLRTTAELTHYAIRRGMVSS